MSGRKVIAAGELLPPDVMRGTFTAEHLEAHDPERFGLIAKLLCEGSLSQRQIADATKASRNTVAAVFKKLLARGAIEPAKKQLAGDLLNLARVSIERATEAVQDDGEKISARDLGILAAVAVDKAQILTGGATMRLEVVDGIGEAELDRFAAAVDAECIAETHLPGWKEWQNGEEVEGDLGADDGDAGRDAGAMGGQMAADAGAGGAKPPTGSVSAAADDDQGSGQ